MHAPVAAIDIGTNSVLLSVVRAGPGGGVEVVEEHATITRLGQGVDRERRLAPEAVERTLACLRAYAARLRACGVQRVQMVGTSALRDAQGGDTFRAEAAALIGCPLEVITGKREAELTFRGAISGLTVRGAVTVFDIGGGSTEIIEGSVTDDATGQRSTTITRARSLDIGSVRLTERHVAADPPSPAELDAVARDIAQELRAHGAPSTPRATLIGVAGTVTTLCALDQGLVEYDPARVHGAELTTSALAALCGHLAALPLAQRQTLPGLEPRRADVIVAGAVLAHAVAQWAETDALRVSDRGVRWGLLEELLAR